MVKHAAPDNEGTKLAKVLWYYNLIPDVNSPTQKIVCPFHGDVNPSMLVNLEDGSYFCFGCQRAGDAAKFATEMERKYHGLNDLQAYKRYLAILKSNKCSDIHIDPVKLHKAKKPKKQAYDESYDYYHGLRTPDWRHDEVEEVVEAREYMEKRGFSPETLQACKAKVTYNNTYGLIFPMLDNGKFKGWVSRTMVPEVERRRKYLYNEGFSRATTLCGEYGKHDWVIVVEGYMDRLKFVQNGITNVVAILGWKMSAQQEAALKAAGVKYILSALDNDECGRKGTQHLKMVFGTKRVVRWKYLKAVKDPGDMTPETFRKMYEKSIRALEDQKAIVERK